MHLTIITMLIRVKMAAPEIQELEDGAEAYLLVEVEDMFSPRSLCEALPELFQF